MFLYRLRSFFNPELTARYSNDGAARESSQSAAIIDYAIGLASSPEAVHPYSRRLQRINQTQPKSEKAYLQLYSEIENYLSNYEPIRKFTKIQIHEKVTGQFNLQGELHGLPLLFCPPLERQVKLGMIIIGDIYDKAGKIVGTGLLDHAVNEAVAGTPFAHIDFDDAGVILDARTQELFSLPEDQQRLLIGDLSQVLTNMYRKLTVARDRDWAVNRFESCYADIKDVYAEYIEDFSVVASIMPEGLVEEERLGLMSREMLEARVKEATAIIQKQKELVEKQVVQRTKELHAEQARLRASINSLEAGFVLIDKDENLILRNQAAADLYGLEPEKAYVLKDLIDLFNEQPELVAEFVEAYKKHLPFVLKSLPFGEKIISVYLAPIFADEKKRHDYLGYVLLVSDITEQKILERSRDEFFSIASHELRTPLTAIRGNASMSLEFYKSVFDKEPDLRDMMMDISLSSKRLIEIVNDFLDISRIEQGKIALAMQPFAIDKEIESIVYEMNAMLNEKGLYLRADSKTLGSLPQVYGDVDRTKQVLYNLIGNAVKFTEKGGITISVSLNSTHLKINITDTGRGIAKEGKLLLFHKFQQAGNSLLTRDSTRGTGLGLYISKILTEKMGGTLQLDKSAPGKGSTFSFTMPIATKEQKSAKAEDTVTDSTTGLTVEAKK